MLHRQHRLKWQRGFVIGPLVYGLIALAILAAIGVGVRVYNEQVRDSLRLDFSKELKQKLDCDSVDACRKAVDALGCGTLTLCGVMIDGMALQIKQQSEAVNKWIRTSAATKAAAAKAAAKDKEDIAKLAGELQKFMAQPPSVPGNPCESACTLVRSQPLP